MRRSTCAASGSLLVLSLLAAAACFVWSARPPAVLWALFTALSLLGLTAIYVISPLGLPDYLDSNADRVVSAVVIGGAALAPLLAAGCSVRAGRTQHPRVS